MKEDFIPIEVWKEQKYETWHLDVSDLNLSELISLRNTLIGNSENGVRVIDGIIAINTSKINTHYRECKKINKENKRKIKRKQIKNENKRRKRNYGKY